MVTFVSACDDGSELFYDGKFLDHLYNCQPSYEKFSITKKARFEAF